MKKFLLGLLIGLVGVAGAGYWLIQDLNRYKPEIETFIFESAGVRVIINGDLSLRLWPALQLHAEDISTTFGASDWTLAALDLKVDPQTLLTHRQNFEQWQINAITLTDLRVDDESSTVTFKSLELRDFALNSPGRLFTTVRYQADDARPLDIDLDATIRYHVDSQAIALTDVKVTMPDAAGVCHVEIDPNRQPVEPITATDEDLIPIEAWQNYNWDGGCTLDRVAINAHTFNNVAITFNNEAAQGDLRAELPEFLGGQAVADIRISAQRMVVEWEMRGDLTNVDSIQLMAWLNQDIDWKGNVDVNAVFRMVGNRDEALARSITGDVSFDGGRGDLNVSEIRTQMLILATILNQADHIQDWPEVWHYQRFIGDWNIDGEQHTLNFDLDDLNANGSGTYSYTSRELDFLTYLTFHDDPRYTAFDVNPLLADLPVPIRCTGVIDAPSCGMNQDDIKQFVANALGKEGKSELREKIDKVIEEDVPEEYRDAARTLLDILTGEQR